MDAKQTFECLQAACDGDRKTFAALVHSQGPRLYAIAVRITRDPALAEDVVQDCFLRVLGGNRSIRKVTAVEAWLAQVAARRAIDLLRSREAGRRREENYAAAEDEGLFPLRTRAQSHLEALADLLPAALVDEVVLPVLQLRSDTRQLLEGQELGAEDSEDWVSPFVLRPSL